MPISHLIETLIYLSEINDSYESAGMTLYAYQDTLREAARELAKQYNLEIPE